MVVNLKIFMIKKFLTWTIIIVAQLLLAWILLIINIEIIRGTFKRYKYIEEKGYYIYY